MLNNTKHLLQKTLTNLFSHQGRQKGVVQLLRVSYPPTMGGRMLALVSEFRSPACNCLMAAAARFLWGCSAAYPMSGGDSAKPGFLPVLIPRQKERLGNGEFLSAAGYIVALKRRAQMFARVVGPLFPTSFSHGHEPPRKSHGNIRHIHSAAKPLRSCIDDVRFHTEQDVRWMPSSCQYGEWFNFLLGSISRTKMELRSGNKLELPPLAKISGLILALSVWPERKRLITKCILKDGEKLTLYCMSI